MATRVENQIEWHRKAAGLTQQELADELGVDKSTVSKWENGAPVHDAFKVRLARRFGVPVHHLFMFDSVREVSS